MSQKQVVNGIDIIGPSCFTDLVIDQNLLESYYCDKVVTPKKPSSNESEYLNEGQERIKKKLEEIAEFKK